MANANDDRNLIDKRLLTPTSDTTPKKVSVKARGIEPLEIVLDLEELIELDKIEQQKSSGLIRRWKKFAKDPKRPSNILSIVADFFSPLSDVRIRLLGPDGRFGDRFLKAAFAVDGTSADYCGRGAQGITRSKMETFTPAKEDQGKPVTAYIYEGAIAVQIVDLLEGKLTDLDKFFATFIAHELGHNLGLAHVGSPDDIMFAYAGKDTAEQITWLQHAQEPGLSFSQSEIATMKALLAKP